MPNSRAAHREFSGKNQNKIQNTNSQIITRSKKNEKAESKSQNQSDKMTSNEQNNSDLRIEQVVQFLPNYDNKSYKNITYFFTQWEKITEKVKISEEIKLLLLKAKFTGQAKDVLLSSAEILEETSYENFKKRMINEFQSRDTFEEIQKQFTDLRQKPEQSISEFCKIFNEKAKNYFKFNEIEENDATTKFRNQLKLTNFLEAIRPDIAFEIRKSGTENFEEATKIAITLEKALKFNKCEEINYVNSTENQKSSLAETLNNIEKIYEKKIEQLNKELNDLKLNNEKDKKSQNSKQMRCNYCFKQSHWTKDCYYKNKNSGQNYRQQHQGNRQNFEGYNGWQNCIPSNYVNSMPINMGAYGANYGYNNMNFSYPNPQPYYNQQREISSQNVPSTSREGMGVPQHNPNTGYQQQKKEFYKNDERHQNNYKGNKSYSKGKPPRKGYFDKNKS